MASIERDYKLLGAQQGTALLKAKGSLLLGSGGNRKTAHNFKT